MEILVEVKNEILGDSVFWRGPAEKVSEIRNIPARQTAEAVAKDGQKRVCGMWHVSAVPNAIELTGSPQAASPATGGSDVE